MGRMRHPAKGPNGSCHYLAADLSAYFDGELEPASRQKVEAHLAACPSCRQQLEGMRKIQLALAGMSAPGGPRTGSVLDRLRARLREQDDSDESNGPSC